MAKPPPSPKKATVAKKAPAVKTPAPQRAGATTTQEAELSRRPEADQKATTAVVGPGAAKAAPAAKPAPRPKPAAPAKPTRGPYADDEKFLEEQRQLLLSERSVYQHQAEDLRAEAESLALEREPGDVQFDEESGEGGTVAVDRERDLTLSAQALATIDEIDRALAAIADKTYGACDNCGEPIMKARLKALPYARLCMACKSGGLHRR